MLVKTHIYPLVLQYNLHRYRDNIYEFVTWLARSTLAGAKSSAGVFLFTTFLQAVLENSAIAVY